MSATLADPAADLYLADETAWLDAQADLIRGGRADELDLPNLAEYLHDMARRDRRRVFSRLVVLLTHLLKWDYQPDRRGASWRRTLTVQAADLRAELTATLRHHAEEILGTCYVDAVEIAAVETGLPEEAFPTKCPYTLDDVLNPAFE